MLTATLKGQRHKVLENFEGQILGFSARRGLWTRRERLNRLPFSRIAAGEQKACALRQPAQDVHVLDRASGLSLHEVCRCVKPPRAWPCVHLRGSRFAQVGSRTLAVLPACPPGGA